MFENKQILFVHGRASKPPKTDLHKFWLRSLTAGLVNIDGGLKPAEKAALPGCCNSDSYWATVAPFALTDELTDVQSTSDCIDELIDYRKELGEKKFHVSRSGKMAAKAKSMVLSWGNALGQALTIKDNVTKELLADVRLYTEDQYVADQMRKPLEDSLRAAWTAGKEVCLLTHSMGTGIAYDVLWRFSHRDEDQYRQYRNHKVKLWVTMGSPLGDPMYQSFLFAHEHKKGTRQYPANVIYWENFAAAGDIVCHDNTLEDDFQKDMKKRRLLKDYHDYVKLFNPYENSKGRNNPHKSFGYLVQPKLAKWVLAFLRA